MSKNLQLVIGFMTISVILTILGMGLFARPENLAQVEIFKHTQMLEMMPMLGYGVLIT